MKAQARVKPALMVGVVALGLAILAYSWLGRPSEEERIRSKLSELAALVSYSEPPNPLFHKAHLNRGFQNIFVPTAIVTIDELHQSNMGLDQLSTLGASSGRFAATLTASFTGTMVTLHDDSAEVSAELELSGLRGGQPQRDSREIDCDFQQADGEWKITRLRVHPKEP